MSGFLQSYYDNVVETPDYIYAEGDIPIALCAHMDTVWEDFKGKHKHMYYDRYKECMWCPEGAGFDDKIGLFLIIKIVTSGLKPCIILNCNEEIGGLGAGELAKLSCPFKELKYCIELDRMGANDCVFYNCDNIEFENYVEGFGFKTNYGSFSDISKLCPAWGIAGVNLSVGYIDEHTTNERVYVKYMLRTLTRVKKMLTVEEVPFFAYIPAAYHYNWVRDFSSYYESLLTHKCDKCGTENSTDDLIEVINKDGSIGYRCYECLDDISWCDYCHEAFVSEPSDIEYICPKCKEMIYNNECNVRSQNNYAADGRDYYVFSTDDKDDWF